MKVQLHSYTPDPEATVVEIARVSSSREDKREDYARLVRYLIKNKHWSPFEHATMTFEIVTSLPIATQFLRHRSFTFQQFSQRYAEATEFEGFQLRLQAEKNRQSSTEVIGWLGPVNEDDYWTMKEDGISLPEPYLNFEMVDGFDNDQILEAIWKAFDALQAAYDAYKDLLKFGVAKECARMILPQCTQTTLYMTGNLRSWIHFLELRDDPHAQKEAQEIAREIKAIFVEKCPVIAEALEWTEVAHAE